MRGGRRRWCIRSWRWSARVYGILADYPDQNDHDALRSDPVFKLIADRAG